MNTVTYQYVDAPRQCLTYYHAIGHNCTLATSAVAERFHSVWWLKSEWIEPAYSADLLAQAFDH